MDDPTSTKRASSLTSPELFEDVGKKVDAVQAHAEGGEPQDGAEDDGRVVDEIESLCMNCRENGTTRLLLTRIPFFREIILMSFACPHCGARNSEIQSAGEIQERGSRYTFKLTEAAHLSRQVIKSDTGVAKFVELDVEIPAGRGQLTTVEGLLTTFAEDLEREQPSRNELDPDLHAKLDAIISRSKRMRDGEAFPFSLELDDPAGNSWIEPSMNSKEGKLKRTEYDRTPLQNTALGLSASSNEDEKPGEAREEEPSGSQAQRNLDLENYKSEIVPDEVYSFPATCPGCAKSCSTHMKMVNIPHFKEVLIMSTVCDHCGYRSNEVKTGGAIPSKGRRITLQVRNGEDLSRDILKSETCKLSSPELSLDVSPGTLGGRFTTLEGLLTQVRDDLHGQIFDMDGADGKGSDSTPAQTSARWTAFFAQMDKAIKAEIPFTVILEDPWAASFVQNLLAPEPDPQLTIEDYERTEEENEDLGLNDIKVDGYAEGKETA
ncbi:MAG: nucleolar zinc-finger protein [Phylliscum demangeonii]|nr:MAG: nucleolar zinc-finger protein [Phylliscum demangeonii]